MVTLSLNIEDEMRKEIIIKPEKILCEWHSWFAWYPVKTETFGGKYYWVWLEKIERSQYGDYRYPHWMYRLIQQIEGKENEKG